MPEILLRPEVQRLLLSPIVFFVTLTVFVALKKVVWRRGRARAAASETLWDDYFFDYSERPLYLLIFGISVTFALQFSPEEVRRHPVLINGAKVFILFALTMLVARLFSLYLHFGKLPFEAPETVKSLLSGIFRFLIYATGILLCLDNLGISITPLIASLGVGSLAVALALQDTLGNLFSGFYLLVDKPIRIGHSVKVNDSNIEGVVKHIGWRTTRIEIGANHTVIIPNSKLSTSVITNYDIPTRETNVGVDLTVFLREDLNRVEKISLEAAESVLKKVPSAAPDFAATVRFQGFQDLKALFTVTLRAQSFGDCGILKHEFIKEVQKRFREEKISF